MTHEQATSTVETLKNLVKENKRDEFKALFSTLSDEEKEEIKTALGQYRSVEGHNYSGWNLFFLSLTKPAGIFGTFVQWKANKKLVKKGSRGTSLLCPVVDKDNEIKFWKTINVFHQNDVEDSKFA